MSVRAVLLLALLLACPAAVRAQTTDKPGDKPPTIHVGGYVQFDYLSDFENRTDVPRTDSEQTFRFRRVRLVLTGTIVENIEYAVTVEVTTTPILRDATIVLKHFPAATIRAGQFVMPYGQEQYGISSNVLEFTERLLTPIVPARDAGVMVTNAQPFGGWFTYAAAITNGTGMNTRDNNDAKDAVVRLTATPPSIRGFQISLNAARGDQPAGMRTRRGADIGFERRAYHLAAEFESEQLEGTPTKNGFYVFGAWRLYPSVPHRSFHHLELGSRYTRMTGGDAFGQWEVAANYYVQPTLRFMCDFIVHTDRAPGQPRNTLHARANFRF